MAGDHQYGSKRQFQLEESTTRNGGKRTIFIEHMAPGTSVPPHYHTRFSETFDLLSGSMLVYNCENPELAALRGSEQRLRIREKVVIPARHYHMYRVGKDAREETVLRVIIEPGDADFERMLMIFNGLTQSKEIEQLGRSPLFMAVFMELTDGHLIGPAKEFMNQIKARKGAEIAALKGDLLRRFDKPEALEELLRPEPPRL